LSETERRVAELVAEGKSNKQVAQVLQLSPGTVAWNLSKVYRKLDLRSRAELAARYGRDLTLPP
jgi:DNA-binding CsgD family transcriptional regulator